MATKKKEETPKANPFKKVTLNLPFHNFETEKEFTGIFEEKMQLGTEKPFMVNVMTDVKTGAQVFVTDSFSIAKAIEDSKAIYTSPGDKIVLHITFVKKTESKGKPFNVFDIEACSLQEYEDSL